MNTKDIEVCFAPPLFPYLDIQKNALYVIVDILRATTSMSIAFKNGAKSIIPVAEVEMTRNYKKQGFLIAGERSCKKLEGFDFGNSPFDFSPAEVIGKTIAFTTTNCTRAIEMAKGKGEVMIASFVNMGSSLEWINNQNKNIVIFCAGWENNFSLEDTVFAGALIQSLSQKGSFRPHGDSSFVALRLWQSAENDHAGFLKNATHRNRLLKLYTEKEIDFCFSKDLAENVIILKNNMLVNAFDHLSTQHSL